MAFHAELHTGGTWTGDSASAWDLHEAALSERFLEPRSRGEEVWVQGKRFRWDEAKFQVYEGPATAGIEDFTSALGPAAYAITGVLTEVTDRFITGPPGGGANTADVPGDAVFLVHGSDIARREEVARFLSKGVSTSLQ